MESLFAKLFPVSSDRKCKTLRATHLTISQFTFKFFQHNVSQAQCLPVPELDVQRLHLRGLLRHRLQELLVRLRVARETRLPLVRHDPV